MTKFKIEKEMVVKYSKTFEVEAKNYNDALLKIAEDKQDLYKLNTEEMDKNNKAICFTYKVIK